ncbi:hypothetical protein KIPB_004267 [Kipferlia bialata]|uniref:AB hydrolase-1 domain-containing protein n=1 Tax=Kipferlia bialata TaxID=797122 RepID=A0A9K3GHN2_9EUKA|nr:hypothetical protein KIPB_004267 [Kipferlia bialata]|eukprot:g4267.t1
MVYAEQWLVVLGGTLLLTALLVVGRGKMPVLSVRSALAVAGVTLGAQLKGRRGREGAHIQQVGDEYVILVHGLIRSSRSMTRLARRLRDKGYSTVLVDYPSTQKDISTLTAEYLAPAVQMCREAGATKIHFVTHSMGGILTRYYLAHLHPYDVREDRPAEGERGVLIEAEIHNVSPHSATITDILSDTVVSDSVCSAGVEEERENDSATCSSTADPSCVSVSVPSATSDATPMPPIGRVCMLGPPNQGSEVVDALGSWWLFQWMNGEAGGSLGTGSDSVPNSLPPVSFDCGVIAGNWTINWLLSLLIPGPNDGKVGVGRTAVHGMGDSVVLPAPHPVMCLSGMVGGMVERFLSQGSFDHTTYPDIPSFLRSKALPPCITEPIPLPLGQAKQALEREFPGIEVVGNPSHIKFKTFNVYQTAEDGERTLLYGKPKLGSCPSPQVYIDLIRAL